MKRTVILYSVLAAVLIFVIRMFEVSFWSGQLSLKFYLLVIGMIFLGLGAIVGFTVKRNKEAVMPPAEFPKEPEKVTAAVIPNDMLTARENEILLAIVQGHSNKEIADKLFVSENTIKKHINNIYSKLGVSRRTQAVSKAKELGIVS